MKDINVAFGTKTFKTTKATVKRIKELSSTFHKGELNGPEVLGFVEQQDDLIGLDMYISTYYPEFHRAFSTIMNEHELLKARYA